MSIAAVGAPPSWARVLGFGGLIPFVGLALAAWVAPVVYQRESLHALVAYGATIASFVGALHWGAAMNRSDGSTRPLLVWAVVPSLLAWIALLVPDHVGLLILATTLVVCFVVDRSVYPRLGWSAWLSMRRWLTTIAALSCLAAALSSLRIS